MGDEAQRRSRAAGIQSRNDPEAAAHPLAGFQAEPPKLRCDEGGGLTFLVGQLRVLMQMSPGGYEVVMVSGRKAVDLRCVHYRTPALSVPAPRPSESSARMKGGGTKRLNAR